MRRLIASTVLASLMTTVSHAEIVRIEVESRATLPGTFGPAGAYEVIKGRAFGELNPADPKNAIIQDIALAPRNARGRVEYSTTFSLSKPVDMTKANGFLFYDVPNRGNMQTGGDPEGRVHVTSGWQGDIPASNTLQYGTFPIARNADGSPVTGPALVRFVDVAAGSQSRPMRGGNPPGVPRPVAVSLDTTKASLVSHAKDGDAGVAIPASDFAFADCSKTPFPGAPDPDQLCIKGGFNPALAYDLVYQGKDPVVMGVGYAATRDVIAYFHHATGAANPVAGQIKYVIGTGVSQSGNFLRGMINLGFTADEAGRRVFDGVNPQIAGRQTATNIRFAVPGGASYMYDAGNEGTVWWSRYNDTVRGEGTHSLLDRCNASKTCPKVFETFGSTEFWALRMSLGLIGTDAKADLPLPANVRRYYFPSVTHGGGNGGFALLTMASQKPNGCVLPANPNPTQDQLRALYKQLEAWVSTGKEPPPSAYPTLAKGELVRPTVAAVGGPVIPGMPRAGEVHNAFLEYDFGPQYNRVDVSGVMTTLPPKIKTGIPVLVPKVNADGNETVGIPSVNLQAPLGTYLGWNVVANGYYKGVNCGYQGGFIPFATTRAERTASGDPRLSLEERYGDHAGFVAKVKAAADALVARGFLLPADAAALTKQAEDSAVLKPAA